ncbi:MAG: bifunctional UDP-N-acetylglucosamine diphosphorylase/glucosamine-1-phosphate N-acetyltransferase GlmU [Myxococcales bacterium]|nr:bifunctional UDP-N-acetylglucosamine diphosphorylase/glucosamine-1-phosphate N-acetyltransferase GlmU [Myxococcales bacterium]
MTGPATPFTAIVLAAGQGTRMKSSLPKVLHTLLERPMVSYPIDAALAAGAERVVVVVGVGREQVEAALSARYDGRVTTALQAEQRGTGDAARCGREAVAGVSGRLVILCGDTPLLTAAAIAALLESTDADTRLALLTSTLDDARGYGRILRDGDGRVRAIREDRDCTEAERAIREWNPGVYAIDADFFDRSVAGLSTDNDQGELYLTDLVERAAAEGGVADAAWPAEDLHGINDRAALVACEAALRRRRATELAAGGVTLRDPETTFVGADVVIEPDVTIEAQVHLRGKTRVGAGAHIDVGCVLTDTTVHAGAKLLPYTVSSESAIGAESRIGPFTHLRPGSELAARVHLGNFVETKKTRIGEGSKANHLAYLGDGVVGSGVNVGAGTIFCNYDGFGKYVTVLEDGVFIGSDSQLVAPITVGKGAYVATGTTVTMDVPAEAMAIGRARQQNKAGLATRLKEKLKAQAARLKGKK